MRIEDKEPRRVGKPLYPQGVLRTPVYPPKKDRATFILVAIIVVKPESVKTVERRRGGNVKRCGDVNKTE
jgi:hypothetical protein